MFILDKVTATNLCAFKELEYTLQQGRTTLIFGNNLDNESQGSNGSGKSALIEAIAFGITGETLRKVKMDEIINDEEDEASVCLSFSNNSNDSKLIIERFIERKNPQQIVVTYDGQTVSQASVNDYNKYILELLGLTKDDVYSNFILSKHKYTSFLSSSDKDKKEIINRFSNGIMVDEAIEALQEDMAEVNVRYTDADKSVSECTGKLSIIDEQISTAINERESKENSKQQKIADWKQAIAGKRQVIREANDTISELSELNNKQNENAHKLKLLEESYENVQEAYTQIVEILKDSEAGPIKDYVADIEAKTQKMEELQVKVKEAEKNIDKSKAQYIKAEKHVAELTKSYKESKSDLLAEKESVNNDIQNLLEKTSQLKSDLETIEDKRVKLNSRISHIKNLLSGVITCPKCQHKFVLDNDVDVEASEMEQKELQEDMMELLNKMNNTNLSYQEEVKNGKAKREVQLKLDSQIHDIDSSLLTITDEITHAKINCNAAEADMEEVNAKLASVSNEISRIGQAMFDEAFDSLDDKNYQIERKIKSGRELISTAMGAIDSYNASIEELEKSSDTDFIYSLNKRKEKCMSEYNEAISNLETIEREYNTYKTQEATFIEFKTHLANSKIDALSQITNEFLEKIGSDIRILFSGYTVLKSGKIRDKISISIVRNGVDCGSFDKFSEGEKARVNLANILAMHKLTNVNCPDESGLDLLILDEILEATDEQGLANIFDALNALGITALVVSHGNIAENYPYKLIVNKQNGTSFINAEEQS